MSSMYDQQMDAPLRLAPTQSRSDDELLAKINQYRQNGLQERRKYEPTWRLCEAFMAGRHWVGWSERTRRIVDEPNPQRRERHTVDLITPYHQTVLGKLYVEDLRPDVQHAHTDIEGESIATHTRQLATFAWENEVQADKRTYSLIHKMLTYGTSAMRCYFDPWKGDVIGEVPIGEDGQPIYDMVAAREFMLQAQIEGTRPELVPIREGRICWEVLSPFQFVCPPGVEDPDDFPWLIIDRVMWLPDARERWPKAASELREQDLRSTAIGRDYADDAASPTTAGKLKEHAVISTYYQMPTQSFPGGRTVIFSDATLLEKRDSLPYKLRGMAHHGVTFFRYHTVDGRFYGKGLVEPLIGPQRQLNRARSQNIELKDRNLGRVYTRKGGLTEANMPVGKIMEVIEIPLHVDFPQEVAGGGIGPWVQQEAEIGMQDMDRVAGLHDISMGRTPQGVEAYGAMALLKEQDERRQGPLLKELRIGIADAMLLTLNLIRAYWRDKKRLAIVGKDGMVEEFFYSKNLLPPEFHVVLSKQSPLPTSPAAQAQKMIDIYHAAIAAGQPLPPEWLKDSMDAGRPLPFPKREQQVQERKAEMEHIFIEQGQLVMPDPFDDDQIHLQIHRVRRYEIEHMIRLMQQEAVNAPSQQGGEPSSAGASGPDPQLAALLQFYVAHEQMHTEAMIQKAPQTGVPALQGGRGQEAQNGHTVSMAGAASAAANGGDPGRPAAGMR